VQALEAGIHMLLGEFRSRTAEARPRKLECLDVKVLSDVGDQPGTSVQFFCNPNAAATPMAAKVMVTFTCAPAGIRLVADAMLTTLRSVRAFPYLAARVLGYFLPVSAR
jgi:hypothetical protein